MAIKKYEAYKDSGIEWIGEIPQGWEICKVKHHYKFSTGFTPPTTNDSFYDDSGATWITISDMKEKFVSVSKKKISSSYLQKFNPQIVKKGSLLFSFKLSAGIVAFAEEDLYTNEAIAAFESNDNSNLDYLYYMAPIFIPENANYNIYGAKLLNQELINDAIIVLPSLAEQQAIAAYLDHKVGQIDSAVSGINAQIADLKTYRQSVISEAVTRGLDPNAPMKDSGIEWIGEIPQGWEVCKVKHICNVTDGTHFSPKTTDKGKPYVTVSNVYNNKIDIEGAVLISEEDFITLVKQGCQPKIGDVLLAKDGTVGRSAIVKDNNDFVCLSSLGILSPSHKIMSDYLKYSLDSITLQDQMTKSMAGSALRRITISKIQDFYTFLPPLAEQQAIADYLDVKTAKIDASIKALEEQRADLLALKQSTISEAVTGKVDVRDWKPANN